MSALPRTRSVAVAGTGIAALAASVAFRRALPEAAVVLFAGGDGALDYVGAGGAFIESFHRLIGLDAELFRRRTGAVAVRESDVSLGGQDPFRFVPVEHVPYVDGAALHHLWLRRSAANPAPGWDEVALRAANGAAGGSLGVRFDAAAYRSLLGDMARSLSVEITDERAEAADLSTKFDLVIVTEPDAAERVALEAVPGEIEWRIEGAEPGASVVERVRLAGDEGTWANPAWSARARWEPERLRAGRVMKAMEGKLLRVGRAAVQCETFDGQPLAVALAGIVRAIELLPRPDASGREAAEYNRRSGMVHDFLLDWAFVRWGLRGAAPPSFTELHAQFAQRGRIPFRDEDPVPPGHWLSWFLTSGERPRHIDLTAMAMSEERLAAVFAGV